MKTLLTSALLLFGLAGYAQQTTQTGTTTTATSTTLSAKARALCKEWTLSKTENFGDQHDPTEKQKNDRLILMENGRYRLINNGAAEGGTWSLDKSDMWLTLTNDDGTVKKFKIMEQTDGSLKVDYRDADDVHNILYYKAAAAATQQKH